MKKENYNVLPAINYGTRPKVLLVGNGINLSFDKTHKTDSIIQDEWKLAYGEELTGKDVEPIALVIVLTKVIIPNSKYNAAVELMESGKYQDAIVAFEEMNGYKDSAKKIDECEYQKALSFYENGEYKNAAIAFGGAGDYKDARERSAALWNDFVERQTIACSNVHTVGLKSDGTVVAAGDNEDGRFDVSDWTDVVAIACGGGHTVGLKSDGTVVAAGNNYYGQCDVSAWTDVVAIACGFSHTVGLKSDGTVVAAGYNYYGQCDVSDWTDVVLSSSSLQVLLHSEQ